MGSRTDGVLVLSFGFLPNFKPKKKFLISSSYFIYLLLLLNYIKPLLNPALPKKTVQKSIYMELLVMHIDNRVESLEEARKYLNDEFLNNCASGTNQGAIDNRIEQAMDLVKSHLMNAVRSEVEELKEKIIKLEETISQQQDALDKQQTNFNRDYGNLQRENEFLRSQVSTEVLLQYSNQQQQPQSQQQQPSSQQHQ